MRKEARAIEDEEGCSQLVKRLEREGESSGSEIF
jgi:hypothetical protein